MARKCSKASGRKVGRGMREMKHGTLKSWRSGGKVKSRKRRHRHRAFGSTASREESAEETGEAAAMKKTKLRFAEGFCVAFGNRRTQAAEMVIAPGDSEGDPRTRHRGADQWHYVVSGTGYATINGKTIALRKGVLILIEREDRHEVKNTGQALLRTLNFYSPPAYTKAGNELLAARRH